MHCLSCNWIRLTFRLNSRESGGFFLFLFFWDEGRQGMIVGQNNYLWCIKKMLDLLKVNESIYYEKYLNKKREKIERGGGRLKEEEASSLEIYLIENLNQIKGKWVKGTRIFGRNIAGEIIFLSPIYESTFTFVIKLTLRSVLNIHQSKQEEKIHKCK